MLAGIFAAALDSLDAAALSAAWSDISVSFPPAGGTNEDRTVTWSIGGARTVTASYGGGGVLAYRIDSGTFTNYAGGFSLSSGQSLGWRVTFGTNEVGSVSVSINGEALDSFAANASGF